MHTSKVVSLLGLALLVLMGAFNARAQTVAADHLYQHDETRKLVALVDDAS